MREALRLEARLSFHGLGARVVGAACRWLAGEGTPYGGGCESPPSRRSGGPSPEALRCLRSLFALERWSERG